MNNATPFISKRALQQLAVHAQREKKVLEILLAYAFKGGDLTKPIPSSALSECERTEIDLKVDGQNLILVEKT